MDNYDVSALNDSEIRSRLFPVDQRHAPDMPRFNDYEGYNDVVIISTFVVIKVNEKKKKKKKLYKFKNNQRTTRILDFRET